MSFVRDVGGSGAHRLEIFETNCTDNEPNIFALCSPNAIHPLPGKQREIHSEQARGGVGKSGVLEDKSGNISETRKDRGKVTM